MRAPVGPAGVRVYYNLGGTIESGRDPSGGIRALGKDRICQVHRKEGDVRPGDGLIDFPRVKEPLDAIGWGGWLVVERPRVPREGVREDDSAGARYLKVGVPGGLSAARARRRPRRERI